MVALLLGALMAGVSAMNVRQNLASDRIISFPFAEFSAATNEKLNSIGADNLGQKDGNFHFKVSPSEFFEVKNAGLSFEDSTESWMKHFDDLFADPNLFCSGTTSECASKNEDEFYDNYQGYDAIIERIEGLMATSDVASEMKSIGKSYEGRDIQVVEIGVTDSVKPIGYIMCNIHAREWLAPMYCSHVVETLLKGHPLLDTFAFAIVPSANPDGYEYSRTRDNLWRKTRKPNSGSSCVGTDGNRNWDDNHCGIGSSTNPCSQTYCGTFPFDQQEVAAVNDYSLQYKDRLMVVLDVHSYGSYILHPFGYTTVLPEEKDYIRMRQCAADAIGRAEDISGNNWRYGTTPQVLGYSSGGTSKDYYYKALGVIYPYTLELRGSNFQPRPSNIKLSNSESFGLLEAMMNCAKKIEIDGIPPTLKLCEDNGPSDVFVRDGKSLVEAKCSELESLCETNLKVRTNCPETCACVTATEGTTEDTQDDDLVKDNNMSSTSARLAFGSFLVIAAFAVIAVTVQKFFLKDEEVNQEAEGSALQATL